MPTSDPRPLWFLELVAELEFPVALLCVSNLAEHLNRPGHGLARDDVAAALLALQADDLIFFGSGGTETRVLDRAQLRATLEPRNDAPKPERPTYFGLTPRGGATWEAFAEPDWTRYIDASWGTDPTDEIVVGASLDNVRAWVDAHARPVPGTQRWDFIAPWQATYWKTLPVGHRFRCSYDPDALVDAAVGDRFERWFRRVAL